MKNSLIKWHLARDNQLQLARFCEKHKVSSEVTGKTEVFDDGSSYFNIKFYFDNSGYIEAELRAGDEEKSYSVADHFQVVDYSLGAL